MPSNFSCLDDFSNSLAEVQIILKQAEKKHENTKEYNICIKSALLFLVAKFEAFLEDLVTEYIHAIENKNLNHSSLPKVLKLHAIDKIIDEKFLSDVWNHKANAIQTIEKLAKLCVGDQKIDLIEIDKKFDYGKHGQKAINTLFSRIGVDNVFSECKIYEKQESLIGKNRIEINITADINSLTFFRNNILHDDITPSITHPQITTYKKHLLKFSKKLDKTLAAKLNGM